MTTLAGEFAIDIAIWLRVHADHHWTRSMEPVEALAERLARRVGGPQVSDDMTPATLREMADELGVTTAFRDQQYRLRKWADEIEAQR